MSTTPWRFPTSKLLVFALRSRSRAFCSFLFRFKLVTSRSPCSSSLSVTGSRPQVALAEEQRSINLINVTDCLWCLSWLLLNFTLAWCCDHNMNAEKWGWQGYTVIWSSIVQLCVCVCVWSQYWLHLHALLLLIELRDLHSCAICL